VRSRENLHELFRFVQVRCERAGVGKSAVPERFQPALRFVDFFENGPNL
jgi:hypothetical protein